MEEQTMVRRGYASSKRFMIVAMAALIAVLAIAAGTAQQAQAAADTAANRDAVVQGARSYIGVKYVNGYPTPCSRTYGIDCECLNRLSYAKIGVSLPSTPEAQYKLGAYRSLAYLKKGDLVFWDEDYNGVVDHTGIYSGRDASGDHMVVHASTYFGKVVESQMKYIKNFKGGRDILN